MKKKVVTKTGPDMAKWKDYRIAEAVDNGTNERITTSRDLYYKIQEMGAFNRDYKIEIVDIEKIWDPEGADATFEITDVKLENGKFIIEIH